MGDSVALVDAGRALAEQWGVMRRETLAVERLRAVAAVLDLGADDPLSRAADLLDVPGVPGPEFDVDALVDQESTRFASASTDH
jgi:hypothetical protein